MQSGDSNSFRRGVVSIRNLKWELWIRDILKQYIAELDLFAQFTRSAELYKLLVYEKGPFPPAPGVKTVWHVGTLVICCRFEHWGTEVIAIYDGKACVFNSSANSEFDFSYAAW
ncbi:hypothetical protein BDW60DRAFT_210081 [Aspergillus nidulans var. acristatus]